MARLYFRVHYFFWMAQRIFTSVMTIVHWLTLLKLFVSSNVYKISSIVTVCLLFLNLYLFHAGCHTFSSTFFPLNIPHGYLPTFPDHFFSTLVNNDTTNHSREKNLDSFLSHSVLRNPLMHKTPPVVHIISCNPGPFTFVNYLSVLSAFKMFKPSALYIHLRNEPELDSHGYYQYLPDLIRDIPVIVIKRLDISLACVGDIKDQSAAFLRIIGSNGGIAINSKTLVAPSTDWKSILNFKVSVGILQERGLILMASAQRGVLETSFSDKVQNALMRSGHFQRLKCSKVNEFSFASDQPCVYIDEDIFPVQLFEAKDDYAALARWIGYGTSHALVSQAEDKEIVPNIVHYVWLGRRKFDFFAYLSLMSSLHVLGAEAVYIHGEEPYGDNWDKVKYDTRVKMINRDFPNTVYGDEIKKYVSHASDFLRGDILLRYGGVYADWDVIFLQPLPLSVRSHHATACVDWPTTGIYPDVFNLGVLVAAPGAEYLRFFLESYRWYLDYDWSYNAIHIPYKIYEKNPQTLNVDRHLQVLCAKNQCHAPWIQGFKDENADHLHDKAFDWRKDAIAIHWTHPDPDAFSNMEALLASDSVEASIGKFVLRKAKLIY